MKIAVTTEGAEVFQHFGNCRTFTIFEVEGGRILHQATFLMPPELPEGHEAIARQLKHAGVDMVICGGIGGGAKNTLRIMGFELLPGVKGRVKDAIIRYLSGENIGDPNFVCNHNHEGVYFHKNGKGHVCHCF